jgi:hypothetical protein
MMLLKKLKLSGGMLSHQRLQIKLQRMLLFS